MKNLLLLPLALGFTAPRFASTETITIDLCWKYRSDGVTLESSTETCEYYSTGYKSSIDAEKIKDEAYESCTKVLGAFNYTQSEKTSLKKGTITEYEYYCQTNT